MRLYPSYFSERLSLYSYGGRGGKKPCRLVLNCPAFYNYIKLWRYAEAMGMDAGSVFFIAAIFLLDLLIRKNSPDFMRESGCR